MPQPTTPDAERTLDPATETALVAAAGSFRDALRAAELEIGPRELAVNFDVMGSALGHIQALTDTNTDDFQILHRETLDDETNVAMVRHDGDLRLVCWNPDEDPRRDEPWIIASVDAAGDLETFGDLTGRKSTHHAEGTVDRPALVALLRDLRDGLLVAPADLDDADLVYSEWDVADRKTIARLATALGLEG